MDAWLCDGAGWRTPIRPGGVLEIFDAEHRLCLQVDAALLLDLLAVHVRTARLVAELQHAEPDPLGREPFAMPAAPRKPLSPVASREHRAALKAARRSRRRATIRPQGG